MAPSRRFSALARLVFVGITIGTGGAVGLGGGGELIVGACGNVLWDGVKYSFSKLFGEELLPNLGDPNHDIAKALASAVQTSVAEIRTTFFAKDRGTTKGENTEIRDFLSRLAKAPNLFVGQAWENKDLHRLLTLPPGEARKEVQAAVECELTLLPVSFRKFFVVYFPRRVELQFLEQLKKNDDAGTAAWRAWQHAATIGIERSLAQLHAKNDGRWKALKTLFEELKHQRRSGLFAKERDARIGELKTQLEEMERRLTAEVRAVGEKVDDLKEDIRRLTDQLAKVFLAHGELQTKHGELQRLSGMTEAGIRAFFVIVGEDNIPFEQQPAKLAQYALQLRDLIKNAESGNEQQKRAAEAIKAGDLDRADAIYAELEAASMRAAAKATAEVAFFRGERAKLAMARFAYDKAADHYRTAADMVRPFDDAAEQRYRDQWLEALEKQGDEKGDNAALDAVIDEYRRRLELAKKSAAADAAASARAKLGGALWRRGERHKNPALLEEAVVVLREALAQQDRERSPLDWAWSQTVLGNALLTLGERESDTARLEQAVQAYQRALEEYTQERMPLQWAMTQNNLGIALQTLGQRESGTARLEQAVQAYQRALEEYTQERMPLQWAATQSNLGNVWDTWGDKENNVARWREAVAAYRAALEVFEEAGASYYAEVVTDNIARVEAKIAAHGGGE